MFPSDEGGFCGGRRERRWATGFESIPIEQQFWWSSGARQGGPCQLELYKVLFGQEVGRQGMVPDNGASE